MQYTDSELNFYLTIPKKYQLYYINIGTRKMIQRKIKRKPKPFIFRVKELRKILGLSEDTVRRYLREGVIIGRKIGQRWYIVEDNIIDFLEKDDNFEKYVDEDNIKIFLKENELYKGFFKKYEEKFKKILDSIEL